MNIHGDAERCRRGVVHAGFTVDSHRRVPTLALEQRNYAVRNANCELHKQQASQYRSTCETVKVKQTAEDPSTILLNKLVKLKMNRFLIVDIVAHSSDGHRVFLLLTMYLVWDTTFRTKETRYREQKVHSC